MEDNIILIHAGLAVLFLLILIFVWIFQFIVELLDSDRRKRNLGKVAKVFFSVFLICMLLSGLYPLVVLGKFELYHFLKLLAIIGIWLLMFTFKLPRLSFNLMLSMVLLIASGYSSFTDSPKLPKKKRSYALMEDKQAQLDDFEIGKQIFISECILCHGRKGNLGKFQAADLTKSELTLDEKIETITHGSPLTVMASFKNILSPEEIRQVANYVHTLKQTENSN